MRTGLRLRARTALRSYRPNEIGPWNSFRLTTRRARPGGGALHLKRARRMSSPSAALRAELGQELHGRVERLHRHAFGNVEQSLGVAEDLSLIHISEPTRRTPISYAVF